MRNPSEADIDAAVKLVGCRFRGCVYTGVVEVQYKNVSGPAMRLCREHAKPYQVPTWASVTANPRLDPTNYVVRDSGRPDKKLRYA